MLSFDSKGALSAVVVSTAGGFHVGAAHVLFVPPPGTFVRECAPVTGRFLVVRPKNLTTLGTLEVIMGWPALVEEK